MFSVWKRCKTALLSVQKLSRLPFRIECPIMPSRKFWKNEKFISKMWLSICHLSPLNLWSVSTWPPSPTISCLLLQATLVKGMASLTDPSSFLSWNKNRRWDNASPIAEMEADGIIWMSIPQQQGVFQPAVLSHLMANIWCSSILRRNRDIEVYITAGWRLSCVVSSKHVCSA